MIRTRILVSAVAAVLLVAAIACGTQATVSSVGVDASSGGGVGNESQQVDLDHARRVHDAAVDRWEIAGFTSYRISYDEGGRNWGHTVVEAGRVVEDTRENDWLDPTVEANFDRMLAVIEELTAEPGQVGSEDDCSGRYFHFVYDAEHGAPEILDFFTPCDDGVVLRMTVEPVEP